MTIEDHFRQAYEQGSTPWDIGEPVEPHFEILSVVSGHFGSNRPDPQRAWVCLMRKR